MDVNDFYRQFGMKECDELVRLKGLVDEREKELREAELRKSLAQEEFYKVYNEMSQKKQKEELAEIVFQLLNNRLALPNNIKVDVTNGNGLVKYKIMGRSEFLDYFRSELKKKLNID